MTRFVSTLNQNEAEKAAQRIGILVSLDLTSGFVRATTRMHDVTFGGNTYIGVGQLGGLGVVREDAELRPNALRMMFAGADAALRTAALNEDYHGRTALAFAGWFDEQNQLVADPQRFFKGIIDQMPVAVGHGTSIITVVCENEWARWARAKPILYTTQTQSVFYPGDLIFDQVSHLKEKTVPWGGHNVNLPQPGDTIRPGNRPRNRFVLP